jgi:predicted RNase H-like nuclease
VPLQRCVHRRVKVEGGGMASRGGPDLPYSIVAGVTPCVPGWLVASAKLHGATFAPEAPRVLSSFAEVLDERPTFSVIALNAPVGYADKVGGRTCDRMARALLGRRGSTVHNAPTRASLEEAAVVADDHLDAITNVLMRRYREVAAEMAPYRQRIVFEVHPELSFFQINSDEPLRWSKKTEEGRNERSALLKRRVPGVERIVDAQLDEVPEAYLLDVAALLWTARRIFARAGTRIPSDPEWDEQGLRMEFVR